MRLLHVIHFEGFLPIGQCESCRVWLPANSDHFVVQHDKLTTVCLTCSHQCRLCKRIDVSFYDDKHNQYGHKPICIDCYNARRSKRLKELKREVIGHYSNGSYRCAVCGSKDNLEIDHINGDGAAQRKIHPTGGQGFYSWLRKRHYPEGYQILCNRCNWAKGTSSTEELKQWILRAADYLRSN